MRQNQMFDDQLIVVTGAAGFIGSSVVRYLNDLGYSNLILVDDLHCSTKWKNLVGKRFVELISKNDLFTWLKGREKEIQAFIHLGACSDTTEENADYLFNNNYRYTVRLAEYALENELRFIYASSAATYGDGKDGFSDDHSYLDRLRPLNMYGYSKHLFDLWALRENVLDKVVGLKYFNVFGPNEYHKGHMASMIYKMMKKASEEGVIYLYKSNDPKNFPDGEQKRDFIYVKDAVRMTCDLLKESFRDVGGIFNIGRGEPISWNQLALTLFDALGLPPQIKYIDMPPELSKQYQNYTYADMRKFNNLYGITGNKSDTMDIRDAVKDYVQNYLLKDLRTW